MVKLYDWSSLFPEMRMHKGTDTGSCLLKHGGCLSEFCVKTQAICRKLEGNMFRRNWHMFHFTVCKWHFHPIFNYKRFRMWLFFQAFLLVCVMEYLLFMVGRSFIAVSKDLWIGLSKTFFLISYIYKLYLV